MLQIIYALDYSVWQWFLSVRTPTGISFFTMVTFFGSVPGIFFFWVLFSVYLIQKKEFRLFHIFSFVLITNQALIFILKTIVARPRPLLTAIIETGPSFPSGHTAVGTLFFGFLYVYTRRMGKQYRYQPIVGGVCLIIPLLVTISRLYVGVHYLSDVLVSVILACIILAITVKWWERVDKAS